MNFKLSNVLLHIDNHASAHPELYFRCPKDGTQYNKESSSLAITASTDFLTYVNASSACKWRKYAGIEEIWLHASVRGKGELCIEAVMPESSSAAIVKTETFDSESETPLDIAIDASEADLVAFKLVPAIGSTVEMRDAYYYAKVSEGDINDVRLALSTTTFQKEEFIIPNIALVKAGIAAEGEPIASHFHMFVVDNGRTLDASALSDDMVTVIPNQNVGGSGGFARGMMAAQDSNVDFTHVLLMDDDVRVMPESLIRTFNLLSLAKGPYKDAFVNGAMLSLEDPKRQFEDVAIVRRSGGYSRIKADMDISTVHDIVENERINVELQWAYGAWWFSCIPMKNIRENGLPMPFFVRCDDVEFGVRNKGTYMTMNGICVWHASFEGRYRASVDCYQYTRNYLTMIAVDDCSEERLFMARLRASIRKALRDMDYASAELFLYGLEDYLKGPEFLASADGSAIMKSNGAKNEKSSSVSDADQSLLRRAGVTSDVLADVDLICHDSQITRIAKLLPHDKHYLPDFLLDSKPAYVVKNGVTTLEGSTFRKSELVCLDPTRTNVSVRHMDKDRFRELRKREAEIMARYRKEGKQVRQAYKDAFPNFTSREFWERYLGMKS